MKNLIIIIPFLIILTGLDYSKTRKLEINGKQVKVTYDIDYRFIGTYSGRKGGFLQLNSDGTGTYKYDTYFPSPNCDGKEIAIEWGLLLDENDRIVNYERGYGFSYPIVYKAVEGKKFKGCRDDFMVDFILDFTEQSILSISSSDDWIKK